MSLRRSLIVLLVLTAPGAGLAQDRYVAEFVDGTRHAAMELQEWHSPDSAPQLGGKLLFDAGNPIRWLIDRTLPADVRPTMFVEFHGGDRLVGEVQSYRSGSGSPYEQLPPHLLVEPESEWQPPEERQSAPVRVVVDAVRRVVFEPRSRDDWEPGHVFLQNGARLAFRSLRWMNDGVSVLLDDGVRAVSWAELAEVHLSRREPQREYVEQLAVLCPDLTGRLVQLETDDGSVLTTSTERFQARHWGDKNRSTSWLQLLQPAWSLDPLWVRVPTVMAWRWWLPHEPPLGLWSPTRVERDAVFSGGWTWQRDRNTQRQRLQVAERLYASGFGVHATTNLTFDLPPLTREFRTRVGLDAAAGAGGSVAAEVRERDGSLLFQRSPLTGSRETVDSGWQMLTTTEDEVPPQLSLKMDMLRDQRPDGADAFDIRDIADWLDPTLRLDRSGLAAQVAAAAARTAPGLAGWTVAGPRSVVGRNHLDDTDARDFRYRRVLTGLDPSLTLTRTLSTTPDDRWLSLVVSRFGDRSPNVRIELKLNGIESGRFDVPIRQGPIDPEPITIPLPVGLSGPVTVEAVLTPSAPAAHVEWRGVAVAAERPGVRAIYDEQDLPAGSPPIVQIDASENYSGTRALRLSAGQAVWPQLEQVEIPIVDLPKLGQFRFVVFAWKTANSPGATLWLANEGRLGPELRGGLTNLRPATARQRRLEDRGLRYGYAYDIGRHAPGDGAPLRLDGKPPTQWRLESRDLINDFGPMTVTGFGLECVELGTAWFDALYLCRTPQDVERVKQELGIRR